MTISASYSISAVAERTGLTPHVIRAWERRYNAISPIRSSGRQRLYSEVEIERLSLLCRAVHQGHSIGKIAALPTGDLRALAVDHFPPASPAGASGRMDQAAEIRARCVQAVEAFDEGPLENTLEEALVLLGHQGLLRLVVAPLAQELGELWRSGRLTAAHEHFFTASAKLFLGQVARQYATPLHAPRIVVVTPAGQLHELGAILAASAAANLGWRVIYLGPNLPAHEIAGAALRNEASAVALSIVYPEDDPRLPGELTALASLLPGYTRLLVGGRAACAYHETITKIGALLSDSIEKLGPQLESIRASLR